ncbi:hypothetical protein U0R10_06900 [Aquirufa sp. OSTEICH-129V]|uniref:Methyltransferase FkbM domain-containing protein n=1 Tax=Aquirufa avitistagni TaxID=3104728 RepID=A0ABW6DEI8_9BACT
MMATILIKVQNKFFTYLTIIKKLLVPIIVPKKFRFKRFINGIESYSQSSQDIFVRSILQNKKGGIYVEIGAFDEIEDSNTFILENKLNWRGVSFEIVEDACQDFNKIRKNPCICGDATTMDYNGIFLNMNLPKQIDYLQLDIEPAEQTLKALLALPLNEYRFSVITYEHDRYKSGDDCMRQSREILENLGYKLVVQNVRVNGLDFEDWYVDPLVIKPEAYSKYLLKDIEHIDIFK